MVEVALEHGARASHLIDDADEINPTWLDHVTAVGLTSGASVPEVLVRDVLTYLAQRGYGAVEEVVSGEESLLFSLPKQLRRDLKAAKLAAAQAETVSRGRLLCPWRNETALSGDPTAKSPPEVLSRRELLRRVARA